jgi:enediyne biosynthesis protein E4
MRGATTSSRALPANEEGEAIRCRVPDCFVAFSTMVLLAMTGIATAAEPVKFTDVTMASKLSFTHHSGATGKKYLPETIGAGAAFLDYDDDGWPDVYLVNSTSWPGSKGPSPTGALFHNNKDGTFTDVTKAAGLAQSFYGIGAASADYDNDGLADLYVAGWGGNHLYRNLGAGKFADVTAKAGVGGGGFGTNAAFLDYDKDGTLDLFVANYVEWAPAKDLNCTLDGKNKSYCTPESYKGQSPILYRNRGDGTFEDITLKAGIKTPNAKALGIAVLDYDGDGWPDLFLANDTQPNNLYRNLKNGTFSDVGTTAGIAFNEAGVARAGMGVDAADYDGSGRPSLVIGNFSNEMMALYHNEGNGLFIDEAPTSTLGRASLLTLTFGCFFFDYDLDGLLDVLAANGHVADDISSVQPKVTYAEPPHLFRNLGAKKFESVSDKVGTDFQKPVVARGAAYADYDNDGDLDVLLTVNNGPARLLRNDGGNRNKWLRVRTQGTVGNRDGIGAKVTVTLPSGQKLWNVVKTGSSFASQSELPLTFGLGTQAKAAKVEVAWLSGTTDALTDVGANQVLTVREGQGLVKPGAAAPAKPAGAAGAATPKK